MNTVIEAYRMSDKFGYAIRIGKRNPDGFINFVAEPMMLKSYTPGDAVNPCIELSQEDLQGLADNLWRLGFVPSAELMAKNKESHENQDQD